VAYTSGDVTLGSGVVIKKELSGQLIT